VDDLVMWIQKVRDLLPEARFGGPAASEAIDRCREVLAVELDEDLRALLAEADGIEDEYGGGLIWPVERIIADNQMFRTNPDFAEIYMPFDALLFFADAGNGDQFPFVLRDGRKDIFAWDHENDSRTWVAPNLAKYLTWWLEGTLQL
jgi:hypothetical protein